MTLVNVVAIHLPRDSERASGAFDVVVDLDVRGQMESYTFHVSPLGMPGEDISIVESELAFVDRFRSTLHVTRDVERLVGQAVHVGHVHLPQVVAA